MLLFYYGSDIYSLSQALRKLKADFPLVEELEFADKDRLRSAVESQGLFAQKKLIVLRDWVGDCTEEIYLPINRHATGKDISVLFLETESPDKRLKFFKFLVKHAEVREFVPPSRAATEKWIIDYLRAADREMSSDALAALLDRLAGEDEAAGYDLWRVKNELDKLVLYISSSGNLKVSVTPEDGVAEAFRPPSITAASVQLLVESAIPHDVFVLTNMFAEGNARGAVAVLENLVSGGAAAERQNQSIQLIGALASQIRALILVKQVEDKSPAEAAAALGWKEGRVWINRKLAKKFTDRRLRGLLGDLQAIDRRLKTSEEAPKLLLTLFLQKARA